MSTTLYYVFVTLLLAVLIGGLLGAGFAFGCKMPDPDDREGADAG